MNCFHHICICGWRNITSTGNVDPFGPIEFLGCVLGFACLCAATTFFSKQIKKGMCYVVKELFNTINTVLTNHCSTMDRMYCALATKRNQVAIDPYWCRLCVSKTNMLRLPHLSWNVDHWFSCCCCIPMCKHLHHVHGIWWRMMWTCLFCYWTIFGFPPFVAQWLCSNRSGPVWKPIHFRMYWCSVEWYL